MIALGLEESVIDPRTWVKMEGFEAPCDRCLFVCWGRPLDFAKKFLENVEEESKLKIPALRGVVGRYGGVKNVSVEYT
ncbi:MAG: hypothetical protein DRO13_06500 [Thermoprotei archaeon]|nr:MAG: hypothetical protein DRO13_06500 [Thermoprotei archaeon]